MQISDISFWGILLVVVMMVVSVGLFSVIDRRMMMRMVRVLFYYVASIFLLSLCLWGICAVGKWWADALFGLLVTSVVPLLILRKNKLAIKEFYVSVALSVLTGMAIVVLCVYLLMTAHQTLIIVPVVGFTGAVMLMSVSEGLKAYLSSIRNTKSHYQYLMANGASNIEALMPSVCRGLRTASIAVLHEMILPVVVTPPAFLCGLLLMGASPLYAGVVTVSLVLSSLFSCLLTVVLSMLLMNKKVFRQ